MKSRSGYAITFCGCPIVWTSKLQTCVALSSCESEYYALSQTLREAIPIMDLLEERLDDVFFPYCRSAPPEILPVILLDSYRCHLMASVVNIKQNNGVQVEHIPGGCTCLCQPIDVGIGNPLKLDTIVRLRVIKIINGNYYNFVTDQLYN